MNWIYILNLFLIFFLNYLFLHTNKFKLVFYHKLIVAIKFGHFLIITINFKKFKYRNNSYYRDKMINRKKTTNQI